MLPNLMFAAALVVVSSPARGVERTGRDIGSAPASRAGMARIPAGSYRPLYGHAGAQRVRVAAFALDRRPVSQGDFLRFVRENPEWRRSLVSAAAAERGYLAGWRSDLAPGSAADDQRPVTGVSRFAATAYCAAQGKRLPTVHEWEYAAAASETRADATRDPAFVSRLLALYATRPIGGVLPPIGSGFRNVYGVRDLHGLAWEWTLDVRAPHRGGGSRVKASDEGHGRHGAACASAAIGASDPSDYPAFMRDAFRAGLTGRSVVRTLGFRCAAG